jgi:hypothetical protein
MGCRSGPGRRRRHIHGGSTAPLRSRHQALTDGLSVPRARSYELSRDWQDEREVTVPSETWQTGRVPAYRLMSLSCICGLFFNKQPP